MCATVEIPDDPELDFEELAGRKFVIKQKGMYRNVVMTETETEACSLEWNSLKPTGSIKFNQKKMKITMESGNGYKAWHLETETGELLATARKPNKVKKKAIIELEETGERVMVKSSVRPAKKIVLSAPRGVSDEDAMNFEHLTSIELITSDTPMFKKSTLLVHEEIDAILLFFSIWMHSKLV